MLSKIFNLLEAVTRGLLPPPDINIWQWADEKRELTSMSSSEPGRWRTSRVPYLREILECLSPDSLYEFVVWMKGAQVAATEGGINWIGFTIDVSPTSMLYLLPTIDMVEKFSKTRLSPSIAATPDLFKKVVETKAKFKDADANTILTKTFPGGVLMMAGANSATTLRSFPIERVHADEVDGYVKNLDKEGDPLEIAIRRTANYQRRKIYVTSTPGIQETSRIEPLFEEGDQRYYYVPCPHCGQMQTIGWDRIKWVNDDPSTAKLECIGCKELIEEKYKTQMLENGVWKANFPGRKIASFHLSALYSPLGWFSWENAVDTFIRANKEHDQEKLQSFVNTILGETWSLKGANVDVSNFEKERREEYKAEVPMGAMLLTAFTDVQDDRLEVEVKGWGINRESWSIDYKVIFGDTDQQDVWDQLDKYLLRGWKHESGNIIQIGATGIDSGHKAEIVKKFCKARAFRRVWPIKGREGFGNGFFMRSQNKDDEGVFSFISYVDELKSNFYSMLRITEKGPGYCHFPIRPEYNSMHFKAMTAEKLIVKSVNGKKKMAWHLPKGRRNEPLDTAVGNLVVFSIFNPPMDSICASGKPYSPNFTMMAGAAPRGRTGQLSRGVKV